MKSEVWKLLQCTHCATPLSPPTGQEVVCPNGHTFPLAEDMPVFLPPELIQGDITDPKSFKVWSHTSSWSIVHWDSCDFSGMVGKGAPGATALCYGSGPTLERGLLEDAGYDVYAFDIFPTRGLDVVADGHKLPFKDNSFDLITSFQVFEHLPRPWDAAKEIERVLKPGGRIVGSVAFLKPFHNSFFHMTHEGIRALLEWAGLRVERLLGAQNIFVTLVSRIVPLGPRKIGVPIYRTAYNTAIFLREFVWRLATKRDPHAETDRYSKRFRWSYHNDIAMMYGPTIIFCATKPNGAKG